MALSDVIYNFQTDPNRDKKLIFIAGWAIFLILLGYGIWFLNQPPATDPTATDQIEIVDSDALLSSLSGISKFPDSASLKIVSTKAVRNDKTFTANNLGELVYISTDNELVIGSQIIPNFPISAPLTTYPVKSGFVFNDLTQSAFAIKDESGYKILQNPPGVNQIIPLNTGVDELGFTSVEEYYFLTNTDQGYILNKSKSLQFADAIEVGTINTEIAKSGYFQLFKSRNTLLIALFENPSQQGMAQYWTFKNGKLTKFLDVQDSWSTNVSENYLIITYQSLFSDIVSSYNNELYELSGQETPKLSDLKPAFLMRQQEIFGNMLARRCTATTGDQLYCLVKEKPVKSDNANEPDLVVKFDILKQTIEVLAENKNIPASSSIVADIRRQRILVSNLKDGQIYELPLK